MESESTTTEFSEVILTENATDYAPVLSQMLEEQQAIESNASLLVEQQNLIVTEVSKIDDNTAIYICTLTFIVVALGALLGGIVGLVVKGR